jgi:hypothetical protein
MRTTFSIVFGMIVTIMIGMGTGIGNHAAYAAKVTASSYSDGYSRGVKDAGRDLQGLNGHGYDSSCPSDHTSVFCSGYVKGYDNTWYGQRVSSSPPPTSQAQSQGQSQGITNNNNPTIIINPPR